MQFLLESSWICLTWPSTVVCYQSVCSSQIPNSPCLLPTVIIRFQSHPPVIDNGPGHQQWVSFCAKQDTQPIICWWDVTSVRYQNSPRPSERLNVSLLAGMYSSPASIFTVNAVPPGPDLFITAFRDELMDARPIQTSTICLACRQGENGGNSQYNFGQQFRVYLYFLQQWRNEMYLFTQTQPRHTQAHT